MFLLLRCSVTYLKLLQIEDNTKCFATYFYTIYLAISSEMLKFAAIFENIMADSAKTEQQFKDVLTECRTLFQKKLHDYGASWRILRPSSLTDQLYIKAKRICSLEIKKESLVGEGIRPEFIALINYGIVGIIQLEKGYVDEVDITSDEALQLYDKYALEALQLMTRKNHDYDEAWRYESEQLYRLHPHQDTASKGNRRHSGRHTRFGRHRCQLYGHHQLCRFRSHQDE